MFATPHTLAVTLVGAYKPERHACPTTSGVNALGAPGTHPLEPGSSLLQSSLNFSWRSASASVMAASWVGKVWVTCGCGSCCFPGSCQIAWRRQALRSMLLEVYYKTRAV